MALSVIVSAGGLLPGPPSAEQSAFTCAPEPAMRSVVGPRPRDPRSGLLYLLIVRGPPSSTLFPDTALCRSEADAGDRGRHALSDRRRARCRDDRQSIDRDRNLFLSRGVAEAVDGIQRDG